MSGADSEQLVNTMAALTACDFEVTIFLPASNVEAPASISEIQAYYHVSADLHLEYIHSIFPGPRAVQKLAHPLICTSLLAKRLRDFDLVYSRNIPAVSLALRLGLPVLYDTYRPWPVQYHRVLVPLFHWFFKHPNFLGIATHSDFARKAYLPFDAGSQRVIVAHNGYNPSLFEPRLSKKEARIKLSLPEKSPIALYSGRMVPEKGVDTLIDLAQHTPEAHFVFVGSEGDGPLEVRLKTLANVTIVPWLKFEELSTYLFASDILMLPLKTQALHKNANTVLPLKLFSYFGAHRAIFAPIAQDTAELLNSGNACLVPADDPDAAIKAFHALVQNPAQIEALALAAKKTAQNYTWDARGRLLSTFIRNRLAQIA